MVIIALTRAILTYNLFVLSVFFPFPCGAASKETSGGLAGGVWRVVSTVWVQPVHQSPAACSTPAANYDTYTGLLQEKYTLNFLREKNRVADVFIGTRIGLLMGST